MTLAVGPSRRTLDSEGDCGRGDVWGEKREERAVRLAAGSVWVDRSLMDDCWTYWGHSGAPLIDAKSGEVVGLHSSWDDETGMRRGVAWEALHEFVEEWCEKV